jgi:Kef-type K+ transport system membrane component KefB
MNYVLRRIDPLSAAKLIAVSAALFMAVYVVIALAVVTALDIQLGSEQGPFVGAAPWIMLVMPFAYLIGVYLVTLLVCLIFNALAGWLGGIRIELSGD